MYRWLVMLLGVHNAVALFQQLVNKISTEVVVQQCVQEMVKIYGAVLMAHVDKIFVGANSIPAMLN